MNFPLKKFCKDLYLEIVEDNISSGAASLAFFLMLSLFPALMALISLGAYLPFYDVQNFVLTTMGRFLPVEAYELVKGILESILTEKKTGLLTFGVLAAVWTASTGLVHITKQLNIAYGIKEDRSFFKLRAMSIVLTLLMGVVVLVSLTIIVGEGWLRQFAVEQGMSTILISIIFPLLKAIIIFMLVSVFFSLIYYFPPNKRIKFKWITPGSIFGTIFVFLISKGFSFYVENFGNYAITYGSIGAVIILMLWLYLFSLILIVGAEINALLASYQEPHKHPQKRQKIKKTKKKQYLRNNEWMFQH